MLFYVFLAVLLASVQAKQQAGINPGSTLSTLQKVAVSGCRDNAKECILKRNTNVTISLEFIPTKDISELDTVVHGVIGNFPVSFSLLQPDACKDTGLSCPLKAGEVASYKSTLPVLSYPRIKVGVKSELKFNDKDVVCILIPAKIK